MLHYEIINHMDIDELRNYIKHLQKLKSAQESMVFAKDEMARSLVSVIKGQEFMAEQQLNMWLNTSELSEVERRMEEKYEQYMPIPVCTGS